MSPWQPTSEGVGFWWSSRPCRPEWLVTVGGGGREGESGDEEEEEEGGGGRKMREEGDCLVPSCSKLKGKSFWQLRLVLKTYYP